MKTLKQFLDGLRGVEEQPLDEEKIRAAMNPAKDWTDELHKNIEEAAKQIKMQAVEADMKRVKEEVVFILSNCVKVLRSDNEDEREAAARELETWLKNANPTKH